MTCAGTVYSVFPICMMGVLARLYILLAFLSVAARALDKDLFFHKFTCNDGLSENTVRIIRQDQFGIIWLGTDYGLNQFDGYRFKKYFFNDPDFNDNIIQEIFPDSRGRLWVGTRNGNLYFYDRLADRFLLFRRGESLNSRIESVYCLAERPDGRMWVGSVNGLEVFDPETRTSFTFPLWKKISGQDRPIVVTAMAQDENFLWVGTEYRGLYRIDLRTEEVSSFDDRSGGLQGLGSNSIIALSVDPWKRLWAATYGCGLFLYDGRNWYHYCGKVTGIDDNLFTLHIDQESYLYIGSERSGLSITDLKSFRPDRPVFTQVGHSPNDPNSLSSNNVRSVFRDRRGNLWVGCFRAGVNFHPAHRKPFERFAVERNNSRSLSNNLVNVIFEDSGGGIWIGTDGGGLNRFDPFSKTFTVYRHDPKKPGSLIHDHVLSIIELNGRLWIGTWGGLCAFDTQSCMFRDFSHKEVEYRELNNIFHLFCDAKGVIWICTYNGLEVFDPRSCSFLVVSSSNKPLFASNWIYTGMQDRRGNIWIGTREGLNRLKWEDWQKGNFCFDSFLSHRYDPRRPRPQLVQEIFETRNGDLYIGTMDGLYRYLAEEDSFTIDHHCEEAGILGISGILEDDQGALWIATVNGLYQYDPDGEIRRFDRGDGLPSNQFTASRCKSTTGHLYFGSVKGFTRFLPDNIGSDQVPPDVVLTDFFLYNRPVPLQSVGGKYENNVLSLTIKPNQNAFAFEFAALDFAHPQQCRYAYRMEGLDSDWLFCDASSRIAAYRNLPAGRYIFHIRATNGDGVWNLEGIRVKIQVYPPFWKSNWALTFYLGIAALLLWFLGAIIRTKAHYDAMLRLDQFKLNLITYISHEFRTPLTLVLGPTSELLRNGNRFSPAKRKFMERIVARNAERLRRLIDQVMDLQRSESGTIQLQLQDIDLCSFCEQIVQSFCFLADSRRISLNFRSEVTELRTLADCEKLEQIISNLLSNAFKFTPPDGKIEVTLRRKPMIDRLRKRKAPIFGNGLLGFAEIAISDTGVGISARDLPHIFERFYRGIHRNQESVGTGIGLALAKQYAELHGGNLCVESQEGKGSVFFLTLPLRRANGISTGEKKQIQENPISERSPGKQNAPLILIIEDDDDLRLFLQEELGDDYAVWTADDGVSGLQAAFKHVPDLIVADVMLPTISGFEVCCALKNDRRTSHIPIILLTARADEVARLEGWTQGADDYITKPFDLNLLRARITNLLENRRRLQELYSRQFLLQPSCIPLSSPEADFIQKMAALIEQHMHEEKFSVEELAQRMGLSRAHFYRKVAALTGHSPHELIMEMRLQRAAQLLKSRQFTVAEIAYKLGFQDPAHFSKSFKKRFNCPPSRFNF